MSAKFKIGSVYCHPRFLDVAFMIKGLDSEDNLSIYWLKKDENFNYTQILAEDSIKIPLDQQKEYYEL